MHFAFLHKDIRLFSSEHSFTSEDRGGRMGRLSQTNATFFCDLVVWKCPLTNAGHAGQVQCVPIEAVAGVTLLDSDTATVLTAIQDPTLLCSQTLEGLQPICSRIRPRNSRTSTRQLRVRLAAHSKHNSVYFILIPICPDLKSQRPQLTPFNRPMETLKRGQ